MLGFRYIKSSPTTWIMKFRDGKLQREGAGLAMFYFAPSSTIVAVPMGSTDLPFIFNETSKDYQNLTVQGHVVFKVAHPARLASLLDYSVGPAGGYAGDDPKKLPLRVTHAAQNATRAEVASRDLRAALVETDLIGSRAADVLRQSPALAALGVEVLEFSILAIKPVPETAKALEAEARETLLREADDAIYLRRNNAVEQERKIKENELATEVAVQTKKRQIEETKLAGRIAVEEKRRELVAAESANARTQADAQSYAMKATLEPLAALDPRALQVLASRSLEPGQLVAMAFQEIATNAGKIGNLNISPELLQTLLAPARAE